MLSKIFLVIPLFFLFGNTPGDIGSYYKEYYQTGKPKAEGWIKNGIRTGYWKFYHKNGKLSEKGHYKNNLRVKYWYFYAENGIPSKEGHYRNGKKANWWLFYDNKGKLDYKCQLSNGIKNGYCLQYNYGDIASASKYKNGKKLKDWYDYRSFKRENNLSDLK